MKKVQSIILGALLAGAFTHASAEDTTTTVDEQITEIQTAPTAQRVQLMNQFKQKLANMNEEDQIKAMTQMRERLQIRNNSKSVDAAAAEEAQKRMRYQTQTQMHQMNQTMNQAQSMNMSGAMQGGKR